MPNRQTRIEAPDHLRPLAAAGAIDGVSLAAALNPEETP